MVKTANEVFRDFTTDGVPSSGKWQPRKNEVRALITGLETSVAAGLSNGGLIYDTKANLDADLVHDANASAWVMTGADAGIYRKSGASGSGAWAKIASLPYSYIKASNVGAGAANAIQATTDIPVPAADGAALIALPIAVDNTASPVTVAINGGTVLTIKTASGNDVAPGGLKAGMIVSGYVSGSMFRLLSDQASAAIQAAAEAAQAASENARDASASSADRAENYAAMLSADKIKFPTVAALNADTVMSYTAGAGKTQVGEGDIVEAEGFRYSIAAEASSDYHVSTAAAVKLAVITKQTDVHIGAYGEIGGANASPAIQKMINHLGYFVLPEGTFNCQDTILLGSSSGGNPASIGAHSRGLGPERSILNANGMAGTDLLAFAQSGYTLARHNFSDMRLIGDADTAINLSVGATVNSEFYASILSNLVLVSKAGPAIYGNRLFSTTLSGVRASSDEDHSFDLPGGNTLLMQGCYAENCGAGHAGYRIRNSVTMIACNGINKAGADHQCMHLGKAGSFPVFNLIGCNLEDFGDIALKLEGAPVLVLDGVSFVAPASGSFETYIKNIDASTGLTQIVMGRGTRTTSKGASMSGSSKIVSAVACSVAAWHGGVSGLGASPVWPDAYIAGVLQELPYVTVSGGLEFGKNDYYISRIAGRFLGMTAPVPKGITANVTTFSVTGMSSIVTANTAPTNLSQFTGGVSGQELTLIVNDANTTVKHNASVGAGRLLLKSGADEIAPAGRVYKFVNYNVVWNQV